MQNLTIKKESKIQDSDQSGAVNNRSRTVSFLKCVIKIYANCEIQIEVFENSSLRYHWNLNNS